MVRFKHIRIRSRMCWTGLLALLIVLSGCGDTLPEEQAPLLVEEINRHIESVGNITPHAEQEAGDLQVYVDRSLSMRPYTTGGESVYFDLLSTIDGQLAGQVK